MTIDNPNATSSQFQVRDENAESVLRDIGRMLAKLMPPGKGFMLMIYDFGDKGNLFYTSNGKREDMINTMKEFIHKQETQ